MKITDKQGGFTAVELLISLFIAAIFLFAGYQLYIQVTRAGSDADRTVKLSNIVYDKLRTTMSTTTAAHPATGCTSNSTTPSTVQVAGLGSIIFTTTITCPFISGANATLAKLFLIRIDASDDGGVTQKVSHATLSK